MMEKSPCSRWSRGTSPVPRPGRCGWRRLGIGILLVAAGWMGNAGAVHAQASREYDLKAVFLYNLASFVSWPEAALGAPTSPFVIGVVGDDPFGRVLDDVVAKEYVGQHPFQVRRLRRTDDLTQCHLLFISNSESRRMSDMLRRVRGRPVLTVGDAPGFAAGGGMIGFATQGNHLQLLVNPEATRAGQLSLSSKLLEVARIVDVVATAP